MKNILIIYHSQSGIVEKMAYAVKVGVESVDGRYSKGLFR